MKNLKRFGALFLTLVLALALSVPALAAVEDTGFSDVDADAWYAEAVMYCREHNLMAGIGNNQFAPESNLTRAQFATVLYRIEGTPAVTGTDAFTDTPDGAWYSDAVLWVSQQNLISGYGGGLFGPNDPVSREQMTTILWRYAGSPAVDGADDYTDEASIASYAAAAVDWASVNSIVVPASTGVFAPKSEASRAHIAAALMNYSRSQQTAPTTPTEPVTDPGEGTKVLIAYFSATNNTEGIANHLDAILDADLYEITPEQPYTAADLNYNSDCRANDEQNDPSARPAILEGINEFVQAGQGLGDELLDLASIVQQGGSADGIDPLTLRNRLDALTIQQAELLDKVLEDMDNTELTDQLKAIMEEKQAILGRLGALQQDGEQRVGQEARLRELAEWLKKQKSEFTEYDDSITRRYVERITVVDAETIRIRFKYTDVEIDRRIRK